MIILEQSNACFPSCLALTRFYPPVLARLYSDHRPHIPITTRLQYALPTTPMYLSDSQAGDYNYSSPAPLRGISEGVGEHIICRSVYKLSSFRVVV